MIGKFVLFLRSSVLNHSFVIGFILSIVIFSPYIFGQKNLYYDAKEVLSKMDIGQRDLNDLIYHHHFRR